jgi:cell division protein FtsQ
VIVFIVVSALALFSLYLYDYLTTTSRLSIREVRIEGVSRVDVSEINRLLEDLQGQNILLAPLDTYVRRLAKHPRVRRASLKRVLPNRVVCSVEEREPAALIFTGRFLEVDTDGMIIGEDEFTPLLDLPIITGLPEEAVKVGKICEENLLHDALETLVYCRQFGGRFAREISELKLGTGGIAIVSLKENCMLLLGDSDYENRLEKYFLLRKTIDEEKPSTKLIDLRFENQVVLRGKH